MGDRPRLFGTDGIRGKANTDLTPAFAMDLAKAAGETIDGPVLIGQDTRRSSPMLAAALHSGFNAVGVDTVDVGVLPTGGISYLTRTTDAWYGVVVSASHNPAEDNGIKFFGSNGSKLSDQRELMVEERYHQGEPWKQTTAELIGIQREIDDARERYVEYVAGLLPYSLAGFELALDCANGSAFLAAPELFEGLGASAEVFCAEPNGTNINDGCGATRPEFLARRSKGVLGLSFDGDADRLIAVDEDGIPANGDVMLAVLAAYLKENERLEGDAVAVTSMANLGFRRAMMELDIELVETAVGDRYVLDAMMEKGLSLGGEQSGHIIFEDRTTGDGLITAVRLLEVLMSTGKPLMELRQVMTEYPQVLRNVRVRDREELTDAGSLWAAVAEAEADLGDDGRVLVRASGTEPLVRVMVEADTAPRAATIADDLVDVVRAELG
ncbi:MAG: phosphoglucosamine mutase [Acidimicrobiia bacterium]|nr:phosphoglucosamine mutase [Acidimicrobiia bacterium]